MYQKSLNEYIKFLFIGQGQVDTWHHLKGLLEASSSRNLEKMQFCMSSNNFAQLCEVENPSTPFSSSWSVSYGHAKSIFTFPLVYCSQSPLCFNSHDCANFSHVHAKLKNMVFQLFFAISLISSF